MCDSMSDHLLQLKEQREDLKDGGAKHEDAIMKENARLQVRLVNIYRGRQHGLLLTSL